MHVRRVRDGRGFFIQAVGDTYTRKALISPTISNERGCRQGRKASPVSEQSPPEQTAWDSQKHILLQAQGRRKPEKSEDDGPHG